MTTKITKWGNSYGIRIPKKIADDLGFSVNTEIDLLPKKDSLELKPKKKNRYSLKKMLSQIDKGNIPEPVDLGQDVGNEIIPPWQNEK